MLETFVFTVVCALAGGTTAFLVTMEIAHARLVALGIADDPEYWHWRMKQATVDVRAVGSSMVRLATVTGTTSVAIERLALTLSDPARGQEDARG